MFSFLQTKLSAFRDSHPIWYCTLDLLFLVVIVYTGVYFLQHFETIMQSLDNRIESAGIFIAALPHSLDATIIAVSLCLTFSVFLFNKEFPKAFRGESSFIINVPVFVLLLGVTKMGEDIISHFPEMRDLLRFFSVAGFVQLGLFVALISVFYWNYASKKADMFMKFSLYFTSIAFPAMYLLGVADVLKRIF